MTDALTLDPEPDQELEPELLDVGDSPIEYIEPRSVSAADGGPDPLATARQLLAGGRGTRGRPPIVYTPTKLESVLLNELLELAPTLVVLSGNAGDGKTAFIETVLGEANATIVPGQNEYDVLLRGKTYRVVLDGSEDSSSRTNDALLEDAFGAFGGPSPTASDRGTLIAINKGRLLRFLETHRDEFEFLWLAVSSEFLGGDNPGHHPYVLIDLNERSVIAPDMETSILAGIVDRLSHWPAWDQDCSACDAISVCPVRFNALTLRDDSVRRRLWNIFAAIDLDDRVHVTARHVVTKIAAAVIGDLRCADVRTRVRNGDGFSAGSYLYSALFGRQGTESQAEGAAMDRVASSYDPTENGSPRRDRLLANLLLRSGAGDLFAERPGPDVQSMAEVGAAISSASIDEETIPGEIEYRQRVLSLVRHGSRRLFMMDPDHELSPPEPVRSQEVFLRVLSGGSPGGVLRDLVDALNATLGVEPGRFTELLVPRDYAQGLHGTGFAGLVPDAMLSLVPATSTGREAIERQFLESWPRALRLDARDSDGSLVSSIAIPLLMFEIIGRAKGGFRPTSQTERSYMVRLDRFYRRLADHRWVTPPLYAMYENGRVTARAHVTGDNIAFAEA